MCRSINLSLLLSPERNAELLAVLPAGHTLSYVPRPGPPIKQLLTSLRKTLKGKREVVFACKGKDVDIDPVTVRKLITILR